jgi:hypothetical protein
MSVVQFETMAVDGFIKIPDELKSQVIGPLHVTVQQLPPESPDRISLIEMIKQGVFHIDHEFVPLTREEAHER